MIIVAEIKISRSRALCSVRNPRLLAPGAGAAHGDLAGRAHARRPRPGPPCKRQASGATFRDAAAAPSPGARRDGASPTENPRPGEPPRPHHAPHAQTTARPRQRQRNPIHPPRESSHDTGREPESECKWSPGRGRAGTTTKHTLAIHHRRLRPHAFPSASPAARSI
jgi:hypothetical protein